MPLPRHIEVFPFTIAVMLVVTVTVAMAVAVQLPAVTRTVYEVVTVGETVIEEVVFPVLHE